ncbi:unnamed protein product, partial [Symbiodinium pilosum]
TDTVVLLGMLTFDGPANLQQACVTVRSSLQIGGDDLDDDAHIIFVNCHNQGHKSFGGGLYVGEDLTMVSGSLEIEHSSSFKGGGGLYIRKGNLHQDGGIIKLQYVYSNRSGGGLLIERGGLFQAKGEISCEQCRAERGGCLALNGTESPGLHSNGSIRAESCVVQSGPNVYECNNHAVFLRPLL